MKKYIVKHWKYDYTEENVYDLKEFIEEKLYNDQFIEGELEQIINRLYKLIDYNVNLLHLFFHKGLITKEELLDSLDISIDDHEEIEIKQIDY